MKIKNILFLTTFLVIAIVALIAIPNNVSAAFPEGMSDDFKAILNSEGQLVVTDSSYEDKDFFLTNYLNRFVPADSDYFFAINSHNEDYSVCNIARNVTSDDTLSEAYDIEVIYQEKFGDEFKKLTDDGEITIPSTSLGEEWILVWNHLNKFSSDKYSFDTLSYSDGEKTYYTISLQDLETCRVVEQHAVNITYNEVFSDEFKKFSSDGKLVITSSGLNGKEELVRKYCENISDIKTGFDYSDFKEDGSACTIGFYKVDETGRRIVQEQHIINISYEEKFDERFNKFTEDGNIVIRSSCDTEKNDIISNFISAFNEDGEFYFFQVSEINSDGTKCVVELKELDENFFSSTKEQHVINITYDTTMSDDYRKHLNSDGKLVINSIKPSDMGELASLIEILYINGDSRYSYGDVSEDLTSFNFTAPDRNGIPESHRVEVVYNYNNSINELAEQVMKDFPHDKEFFEVRDLELINYWLHVGNEKDYVGVGKLDNYSSELKSYFKNRNFEMTIDHRMGMDEKFATARAGIGLLQYDGITYCIKPYVGVLANHILYVPDDTPSTKEGLLQAVQKRVNDYAGEGKVKITAGEGTIVDFYKNYASNKVKELQAKIDAENAKAEPNKYVIYDYKQELEYYRDGYVDFFLSEYEVEGGIYSFLQIAEGDFWFIATIDGQEYEFIVVKDSKKMITPEHKTVDLVTNVEISSKSNSVPLDTSIEAQKLTSGTEYNRVIKVLEENGMKDVQDNETFDLKLYSNSLNEYVTKLEDGDFEVRLPLPDKFKDNDNLKVYYVDDNEKVHEYDVVPENGYAIFTTDHFSIYTLTEKIEIPEDNKENDKEDDKENNVGDTNTETDNNNTNSGTTGTGSTGNNESSDTDKGDNPHTGDSILFFVGMLFISAIGVVLTTKIKKSYKTK